MTLSRKTAKNEALPKGWQRVKLGELCEKTLGGGTPSTANTDYWKGRIPWMTSADIVNAKTIKPRKYITAKAVANSATNLIPKNNIIVVTRVGLGKAVKNEMDICISQDSQGLILKKSVSPDFLIHSLIEKIKVFKLTSQGSTIQGITKKRLLDIEIPLPPLYEQRAIASLLEAWDTAVEKTEALIAAKENQFKWLMKTLISDQQGNNGWRRVRLNTVASVKTGPFGAQLHQHDYVQSNGTPIVTVEHLSERGLIHKNLPLVSYDDKQRLSQYLIQEGDIVFSRVGSVDRSALVSKDEDGWLFSGRLLRVRPERDDVYSSYLNYFFHTRKFRHHMKSIAVGGTMPSINTNILSNVIVPLPSMENQRAIASLLETWDTAIEKTKALAEQYCTQKRGLMQKLLTGKWRIK